MTSCSSNQAKPPIFFLHVEKTGGTSLTNAMAALFPATAVYRNDGSISLPFLESIEPQLEQKILIAGHAQNGVAKQLKDRARIVTMLRDPQGQAVSHFFHARLDQRHIHHQDACDLSFFEYGQKHPLNLIFQLWALYMSIADECDTSIEKTIDGLPAVVEFLQGVDCIGILDRQTEFCDCLSSHLFGGRPIVLPHLNSATHHGVPTGEIELAKSQYRALSSAPGVARLIRTEYALYKQASLLAEQFIRTVHPNKPRTLGQGRTRFFHADRFQMHGGMFDGSIHCPLRQGHGHLVYGPYTSVSPGRHVAEFHLDLLNQTDGDSGRLVLEVVTRDSTLARRAIKPRQLRDPQARQLRFSSSASVDDIEFRTSAGGFSKGTLRFDGVSLHSTAPKLGLWSR